VSGSLVRGPMPPGLPSAAGAGMSAGVNGVNARVLDFRRGGAALRRRRRHPLLLLLRPLATALGLVALPLGVAAWVFTAPRFGLREVVVEGGPRRAAPEWIRQALAPCRGQNLLRLSLAEATARLQRNPWIETVELRKELPDRLHVEVTERRPVALLRTGGALFYADTDGHPIAPVDSLDGARRAGLLEVRFLHPVVAGGGGVGPALEVAGELGRVRPDWAAGLTQIEVLGEEDFRLHTGALPFPLLVTRGQVGPKARRLEELLPELERRYPAIEAVDLRFSRRIVVQPGVPVPAMVGGVGTGAQS